MIFRLKTKSFFLALFFSSLLSQAQITEAGIHIFDNRPTYASIAIEAQGWPDAPNRHGFPSIKVTPNRPVIQVTEWRFTR